MLCLYYQWCDVGSQRGSAAPLKTHKAYNKYTRHQ